MCVEGHQTQWCSQPVIGTMAVGNMHLAHRIPAANAENKLLRQRWIQNIHRADPFPKDENFFVCANHFKKECFQRDRKVRNIVSAYLTCILPA